MKRFDPSYEAALRLLPRSAKELRYVSVEVQRSRRLAVRRPSSPSARATSSRQLITRGRQPAGRAGRPRGGMADRRGAARGFASAYCSSLVHDVNAVHGLLDAMGVPDGEVVGAQLFAGGAGGLGTVRLLGGRAVWNMVHLTVPKLADYRERIALYFDDAILELVFPSPWLNHQPTELRVRRSDGMALQTTETRCGFEEAYIRELKGFWAAVVEGAAVRNTVRAGASRPGAALRARATRGRSGLMRAAIVGSGGIARIHARLIRELGGEVVAVCGRTLEGAASLGYGVPFDDLAAMLATVRPEVVHVCTPNYLHAKQSIAAFAAGAHVLCEKPLATKSADARRMIVAAAAAGRVGTLAYCYRGYPLLRALRREVATGRFGQLRRIGGLYLSQDVFAADKYQWHFTPGTVGRSYALMDYGLLADGVDPLRRRGRWCSSPRTGPRPAGSSWWRCRSRSSPRCRQS